MRNGPHPVRREPTVLAAVVAGAAGATLATATSGGGGPPPAGAAAVGALAGLGVGILARRRTWAAERVEDELLDAEMAMEGT